MSPKLVEAREKVANVAGENYKQILRYIRLTQLTPQLLEKIDEKKLAFIPAVELSYLKEREQKWSLDEITRSFLWSPYILINVRTI